MSGEPMNAKELAEKILRLVYSPPFSREERQPIESLLSEALEKAHQQGYLKGQTYKETILTEVRLARREAFLDAAKIAEEFPIPNGFHEILEMHDKALKSMIAEKLRQKAGEIK